MSYPGVQPAPIQPTQPVHPYPRTETDPTGTLPISAPPLPTAPAPEPPARAGPRAPRRRVALPVLSALLALFVLLAGVATALLLVRNSDYAKAKHAIAAGNQTIRADDAQNRRLQDELDKARQDLKGSQQQVDELKHETEVITSCFKLVDEATDAAQAGDRSTAQAKLRQAKPICAEAQRYLGG